MLADPKASALVDNFAAQWLRLRQLASAQPEGVSSTTTCARRFEQEARLMFASVVTEDRNVLELLDADYTFLNEDSLVTTASMVSWAITSARSACRRKVRDAGCSARAQCSRSRRSRTALRRSFAAPGFWRTFSASSPSPPPPGVENNLDAAAAKPTTLRARLAEHRTNKACASCHNVMDPIGLALENYDHIGKWRTLDSGLPIDTSGVMVDGTQLAGPADLRKAILSRPDAFVETFIEKLMTFGLGRHVTDGDMPAIRHIEHEASRQGDRFSAVILGIVESEPFLMRTKAREEPSVPEHLQQSTTQRQNSGSGAS